jgi:N-acyl-D-aspartate/D-glutamate deacylase
LANSGFDLLIQKTTIIDGTGQPAYHADVAIRGNRIAAVGNFPDAIARQSRRVVDAAGLTLIPGIIDPHSHADLILPLAPREQARLMRGKIAQGITTTIIGNCGLGCAPVMNGETEQMLRAVNAWMSPQSVKWNWRTFGEYLSALESNSLALNVAALVPHGPIRISAMGLAKGAPSARQMRQMRTLTEAAMQDGALGLSTGLIYPPGMYSAPEELESLARVVATHGGIYTSHIRGSSETLIPAVNELLSVGRRTGARIHHSHNEAVGRDHWSKIERVLQMEEAAEGEGVRISFDMFPYTAAATMMIALYPPWSLEGGVEKLLKRLQDEKTRANIRRDIERVRPSWPPWRGAGWPHNLVRATGWGAIHIGYVESRRNKRYENCSLMELARHKQQTPFDVISDLLIEERGQVSMLIFEVTGKREERELLAKYARHRLCAFCTDAEDYGRGLPHPAAYGAFPRILSRFVREDEVLTFEQAIHKMTLYPAQIFGLANRGVIRPGAYADLVLLNAKRLKDKATFARPRQLATGIEEVFINGAPTFSANETTAPMNGQIIRRGLS